MNVASFPEKNGPWMQSDRAEGSTRPFAGLRTGQGQSPSSAARQRPRNSGLSQSHTASPVRQALHVPHPGVLPTTPLEGLGWSSSTHQMSKLRFAGRGQFDKSVLAVGGWEGDPGVSRLRGLPVGWGKAWEIFGGGRSVPSPLHFILAQGQGATPGVRSCLSHTLLCFALFSPWQFPSCPKEGSPMGPGLWAVPPARC